MSFITEADSIRSKLHLGSLNPFMLVGLVAFGVVVLVAALHYGSAFLSEYMPRSTENEEELVINAEQSSEQQSSSNVAQENAASTLFIHVGGAVSKPGLYELSQGARVKEAIDAAGGFTKKANIDSINLAEKITDGQQLVVAEKAPVASTGNTVAAGSSQTSRTSTGATGKVNINLATAAELQTLNGVGEATAEKILAYRQEKGRFQKPEDLKKVSGIGDKKFEALKDSICV